LLLLRWPDRDVLRYAGVTSGPFGAAGVQFLLSLILLRVVIPQALAPSPCCSCYPNFCSCCGAHCSVRRSYWP
jgi:hypothetical protein